MGIRITAILCIIGSFLPYTSGANYTAYWNVPTWHCRMNISSVLDTYEIVHNTNESYIGDRVALFYEYKFGRYPYYKDYNLSIPIYSGTPQNVSREGLNDHITVALRNITDNLKCEDSSGLGVVDFEEWRPLYDINSVKKEVYKIAAIQLTNETRRISDPGKLNQTAKEDYDAAAKEFLLATLKNATNKRNKTLWGMYGFPYCNYDAGILTNSSVEPVLKDYRCSDKYRKFNDRMEYIFNASQALYPSIYLNNRTDYQRNFRYVQAIMAETLRVARNYTTLPIYVYSKFEYDPLKYLCSFYTKEDLCSTIVLPYVMGADGIIFWSSSTNMTHRCDIVRNFTDTILGPLVQKVVNESRINGTSLTEYNVTSTILTFNETCNEYLPDIQTFLDSRCPNLTTTTPTSAAAPAAP